MKTLFDTSLLVAATLESHADHERAIPWLERAHAGEFPWVVGAHTLAELYSVLTALPRPNRLSPAEVLQLIRENILSVAEAVALTQEEYMGILAVLASNGIVGGSVYDALLAGAARKAGAGRIVTFNVKHFRQVCPDADIEIVLP